jgi:O-antigen ligase
LLGVVYVAVPGMLGTITQLFTGISSDTSAASRTDSYALAGQFIARAPVFGRGFATFLPAYRILDNQYLGTLIEMGVVGLVSVLALFLTGMWTAWRLRRQMAASPRRQLGHALLASVAAGALSFAFFDAFSFPQVAGLMFFVLGCVGAARRLAVSPNVEKVLVAGSPLLTPTGRIPLLGLTAHGRSTRTSST